MGKNTNTQVAIRTMACLLLMIGSTIGLYAQKWKTNQIHMGVIYPFSTNGKTAPADTNNYSLHLISGISQQENRLSVTGVSGVIKGDAFGIIISGVSNHIGRDASGVQVAGLLNHIGHDARGIQIAGLMNRSGDANMQVAGLVNVAKRVKGVQLAGLVNIAEESDYPIGILNIIKEGEMQLGLTVDEGGSTLLALRSGGKVLYGLVGLGYNVISDDARYSVEAGIGAHLISKPVFRLNGEVAGTAMTSFAGGVYGKQHLRILAGFRITPRIELFAGPTLNHLLFDTDQPDIREGRYLWEWRGDDLVNGFYFGGTLGLQFSL